MRKRAFTNLAVDSDNTLRNLSQDCSVNEIGKMMERRRVRENRNWRYSGVIMFSFEVALEMTEEIINPHSLSDYL